jgi:subtilisin family serine protease
MTLALAGLLTLIALALPASGAAAPPDSYIVVLKDSVSSPGDVARDHARANGAQVSFVYGHALKGYAARIPAARLNAVRNDSRVDYVAPDGDVTAFAPPPGKGWNKPPASTFPSWGLDRIDQRLLPFDNQYLYTSTGAGVTAYIIDTGIRTTHADFGGRASSGYDAVDGGTADDCNGHGTHVAGTVGGTTYGVAKGVSLVAVRVLNCSGSGTWSGVIAGINWVVANHGSAPAVANMSLGGGANSPVDTAVQSMIDDGVSTAVAAGNSSANACSYSPARVGAAMTIGATTSSDSRASYSNYGSCLDWFAPGSSIKSDWSTSDTATNTISGTSMATPHTAGAAARYLQGNTSASPLTVRNALATSATSGVVGSPGSGSPNLLLYADPSS